MISKMSEQLRKLFVVQEEKLHVDDIEKERMTDTQRAYGLLLHAANIEEYELSDDVNDYSEYYNYV